jgi:hypothetical protein
MLLSFPLQKEGHVPDLAIGSASGLHEAEEAEEGIQVRAPDCKQLA